MPHSSPSIRRFVHHTLIASAATTAPDVPHIAAAFDHLCGSLRARLHPIFGPAAVDALFGRAVQQSTREFPWLASVLPRDAESCAPNVVIVEATRLSADAFAHGLAAVLAHQITLLTTFIGEDVTMPLIYDAWHALPHDEGTEGSRQS